jgi:RNA polymerase sigma factor (sigma-70 family)
MKKKVEEIQSLTDHLFRSHYGKMVSYMSQKYGYHEIENILDSIQEAFEAALKTWKYAGIPDNHFAWLYKVASNKLLNKLNHNNTSKSYLNKQQIEEYTIAEYTEKEVADSLLKLLIFFSKVDFSERNKLVISLYYVAGFGYAEIANGLILNVETVKKVILRSKETIKQFAQKYADFNIESIDQNLTHLLKVIYLLFNEGYKTTKKNGAINHDLCYEAIRLAKLAQHYVENDSEVNALLALMFFNTSRFPARISGGNWVSLENQDRQLWDQNLIAEGFRCLKKAKDKEFALNKYYLEAVISSVHSSAANYEETNWKIISFLYMQLAHLEPNSIAITLNRIISASNYQNIDELIAELNSLESLITKEMTFTYCCTKAHLYVKQQDLHSALLNYNLSLAYAKNKMDINFVNERISSIVI